MALTKPKLSQNIDTDISVFSDPILVLHQGSTQPDIDVGFLMNRSNGLTANAAVIWQESSKSFVHILTNSSGVTDSNLVVQSYANVSVGNVLLINNAGIYVDGTLGSAGQVLQSDGSKTYWGAPGGFSGGAVPNQTTFASNLVVSNTTASASNVTGALVVLGGAGIAGNVYANALRTTTGIYWAGNGNPIAGITYTASASSPAGPSNGDQWYDTVNDILYEYIFDGTSSYWVDIQTSVIAANASTAITDSINANIGAFYTYANTKIGTNANNNIIASNIISTGSGVFQGPYNENSIISGVFVGNTGTAPGITPRVGFFNGNTQQNWQIDNNLGEFRWFVPGATRLSLYPNGNLNVVGSLTVGGKKAVNGPAFSAYADATLQTITSGSQQKVLFQTEEFDTDNCYTSSRFTPNVEGYYQLNAEVRLDGATGTGEMMIVIWKNGAEYKRGTNQSGTQIASNFWAMQVSSLVYANGTTDFFEIYVQQGSGTSVTVTAVNSPNITWFNGAMVRGA
jgi:hypothetical protein